MEKIRLLFKFMKGYRMLYLLGIISVGLATLFSIINPLVLRAAIDSIIGNEPLRVPLWVDNIIALLGGKEYILHKLWIVGLVLVSSTVLRGVFLFLKGKWSAVAAESMACNMRDKLYDHLQHLPFAYHVQADTGDLIQRCTSDLETIRRFLVIQFVEVGRAIFMLGTVSLIMFRLNVRMAFVALAAVPVIFIFAVIFFLKIKKAFKASDEAEARMSTVLQENLTGVRVVRAFARQFHEVEKFACKNGEFRDLTYRLIYLMAWYWGISDLVCFMQIGAVVVLGSYWAAEGLITLGTLVVFITYEGMLLWPVRQMGRILSDMGKAFVSLERIEEIFNQPVEELKSNGLKPDIKGNVQFKNIYFGYNEEKPLLKDISFEVKQGQTAAILGSTGSGKSTLMYLLAGLYDYQQGSITIDGIDINNINKKWLRQNVGLVLQEPFLFARSVRDNIGLAGKEADEAEIIEAARTASVHDTIVNFDKGYDTYVGERGVSLSGGQKQRIAIARTLIRDCPIIIFDDSLSAVDTETDAAIRAELQKRNQKATTFIISHRITTLARADIIFVLEDGRITQKGTHTELIKEKGIYRRVWQLQNNLEQKLESKTNDVGSVLNERTHICIN